MAPKSCTLKTNVATRFVYCSTILVRLSGSILSFSVQLLSSMILATAGSGLILASVAQPHYLRTLLVVRHVRQAAVSWWLTMHSNMASGQLGNPFERITRIDFTVLHNKLRKHCLLNDPKIETAGRDRIVPSPDRIIPSPFLISPSWQDSVERISLFRPGLRSIGEQLIQQFEHVLIFGGDMSHWSRESPQLKHASRIPQNVPLWSQESEDLRIQNSSNLIKPGFQASEEDDSARRPTFSTKVRGRTILVPLRLGTLKT